MTEFWLPVFGYEGIYEVSNLGRIQSIARVVTTYSARAGKIVPLRRVGVAIATSTPKDNYPRVSLSRDGKSKTKKVATVVCTAFHGVRPPNMQACHGDGDKSNNRSDNLRWGTAKENQDDRKLHGTDLRGEGVSTAKFSLQQVKEMKFDLSFQEAKTKFGVSKTQFYRIKKGEAWAHA